MIFKKSEVVGPHVIEPTGETTRYSGPNTRGYEKRKVWACKYCDWEGIHPDECFANIAIKRDCDGIGWLESEKVAFDE